MSVLSVVFWGLLTLSLLVFVHEGGHYLAARVQGMRVTEFFLGLPCPARLSWRSRARGTEFGVTPLLLGGYTRICGMEGEEDPLLADALMAVQRAGTVRAADVAERLGVDEDRAYALLGTLADWGSIEPAYDPELGERPGQASWPESFRTLARDARLLNRYDRGHDLAGEGATADGEPRDPNMTAGEFLAAERSRTYLGGSFWGRVACLVAGPAVNVVLALALVVLALSVVGIEVDVDGGTMLWRVGVPTAIRLAFGYAGEVARFASQLIMPTHTMEVLESSSSVVGISVMAQQAAQTGLSDFILLVASVSMSLGFMNLLPIPPLDGGKILVEVIQLVLRRPLSLRAQTVVSYVGLAFFLFVFVFALRNDIIRYVIG